MNPEAPNIKPVVGIKRLFAFVFPNSIVMLKAIKANALMPVRIIKAKINSLCHSSAGKTFHIFSACLGYPSLNTIRISVGQLTAKMHMRMNIRFSIIKALKFLLSLVPALNFSMNFDKKVHYSFGQCNSQARRESLQHCERGLIFCVIFLFCSLTYQRY